MSVAIGSAKSHSLTVEPQNDPQARFRERLLRAVDIVAQAELSGALIAPGPEMEYLLGFSNPSHERLSALSISADARITLVLPHTDLGESAQRVHGLPVSVTGWADGEDAHSLATMTFERGPVALGSDFTTEHVLAFSRLVGPDLQSATEVFADLFMRKDAQDLAGLKEAARAIDSVHSLVPELLVPGRSEAEVAEQLHAAIAASHASVDFVIVGSGPNGAHPHHSFSQRRLELGDTVVVDLGGQMASGLRSDETRTYVVGGPKYADPQVVAAYELLRLAHAAALDVVDPGVPAQEVDRAARAVIAGAGYGKYFIHRTGHGIGLRTHEHPYLVEGNQTPLSEGMCFSIEPGIYVPGEWGMRLEDIVTVTSDGVEALTRSSRLLR